jgi:hypothetical protein
MPSRVEWELAVPTAIGPCESSERLYSLADENTMRIAAFLQTDGLLRLNRTSGYKDRDTSGAGVHTINTGAVIYFLIQVRTR